MRAPLSKVLSHAFVVGFALATGETAWALPKNHCVLPPPASSVVPYRRRSTASATASPIARTRFPLNAGLGNDPINRDFDARSCVNNWPHESIASSELARMRRSRMPRRVRGPRHTTSLKALDRHAIFDDPCCLNFRRSPSPFGHGAGVAYACGQGIVRTGEAAMAKVLNEILLFSSMAVFVTGIVLAAARLLI
jgi:hypothetical protein